MLIHSLAKSQPSPASNRTSYKTIVIFPLLSINMTQSLHLEVPMKGFSINTQTLKHFDTKNSQWHIHDPQIRQINIIWRHRVISVKSNRKASPVISKCVVTWRCIITGDCLIRVSFSLTIFMLICMRALISAAHEIFVTCLRCGFSDWWNVWGLFKVHFFKAYT